MLMESMEERGKNLGSQFWHACAGSMVQMPAVNSKVYYFPQGHSEHASGNVDFRNCPRIPAYIPCRVSAVNFMADTDTDEVFVKMRLVPIRGDDVDFDDDGVVGIGGSQDLHAKTLTQSDANNGGGFSVPRDCAESIFPRLNMSNHPPPVQTILVKDVHGQTWNFRHIYRGSPKRHLLTTGWSTFVNQKKLVAGDTIVFFKEGSGDLCIGIRRAKRKLAVGNSVVPCGGFTAFLSKEEGKRAKRKIGGGPEYPAGVDYCGSWSGEGKVKAEDVIEAASLAATGRPFDVVYYPRASTPQFCVKANLVKAALQICWCSGMRFKMGVETEDSSRISWFMGIVSSVQVADPIRWPDSPWRLLQVEWDEPGILQNVKRLSPWLVELVSNMPPMHVSPFAPPRKKIALSSSKFAHDAGIPLPSFSGNPFGYLSSNTPAGMQGARHTHYNLSSLSNLQLNKLQLGLVPIGFLPMDRVPSVPSGAFNPIITNPGNNDNISCLLSIGNSTQGSNKSSDNNGKAAPAAPFMLFGQPILTETQISLSSLSDTISSTRTGNSSSDGSDSGLNQNEEPERSLCDVLQSELSLGTSHCKTFMESDDCRCNRRNSATW